MPSCYRIHLSIASDLKLEYICIAGQEYDQKETGITLGDTRFVVIDRNTMIKRILKLVFCFLYNSLFEPYWNRRH